LREDRDPKWLTLYRVRAKKPRMTAISTPASSRIQVRNFSMVIRIVPCISPVALARLAARSTDYNL